ncbi:amidase [Sciscionella marina]|uniref:amidase n=1 Tax=Sciscionella marina TaxID=508770 RepID=UPI000369015B|nr:amidase [Sciscionella marina]
MSLDHPADWGVIEASEALHAKRISAVELTGAYLSRIATRDDKYGAWIRVYEQEARAAAAAADQTLTAGTAGPLTGIPVGLKEVVGVSGLPLTADSAVLQGNVARIDATAWTNLREAGMVLLGHLHCGEFACGTWGINPWNISLSPGGSSSGSGIALATRTAPATVGSDGRGSIRMPAAFNSVTGVKPTFGLISTAGCIPITFTYDVVGPMARSAADCALLLSAMAGRDETDCSTYAQPAPATYPTHPRPGTCPAAGTRVGVPRFADHPFSDGVATMFERFKKDLTGIGVELVEFDWPENPLETVSDGAAAWAVILAAETRVLHAQFDGRGHLYRDEFTTMFADMDNAGSAIDYVRAQANRAEYARTWTQIFAEHRLAAIVHPGSHSEPFGAIADGALPLMQFGCWNDANFPVVSVPAGFSPTDGSPIGMQLAGPPFTEAVLLQLAIDIQAVTDHHLQIPPSLDDRPVFTGPRRKEGPDDQAPYVPLPSPLGSTNFSASSDAHSRTLS